MLFVMSHVAMTHVRPLATSMRSKLDGNISDEAGLLGCWVAGLLGCWDDRVRLPEVASEVGEKQTGPVRPARSDQHQIITPRHLSSARLAS